MLGQKVHSNKDPGYSYLQAKWKVLLQREESKAKTPPSSDLRSTRGAWQTQEEHGRQRREILSIVGRKASHMGYDL